MLESLNDKRAVFLKNRQRDFLSYVENKTKKSKSELASILKIHPRTLREWKKETYSISLSSLKKLCTIAQCGMPANITVKHPFWWTKKAAIIGGQATYKKYGVIGGNQQLRKMRWREWWDKKGKFKKQNTKILERKQIRKPKLSNKLAEFVGIVLGDGGITERQITISLHHITDKQYSVFVSILIKQLFRITPAIYHHNIRSINAIVISRTELIEFCVKKLGLKIGNKIRQQVDIPDWIKKNEKYQIACIRGLMDTDGTVIIHSYKVKNKKYTYKKLAFTSGSRPLLKSTSEFLTKLKIKNRSAGRNKNDIRIDSKKDVKIYFELIGTHNPKHLKRYLK